MSPNDLEETVRPLVEALKDDIRWYERIYGRTLNQWESLSHPVQQAYREEHDISNAAYYVDSMRWGYASKLVSLTETLLAAYVEATTPETERRS